MLREWFDQEMTRMAELKSAPTALDGHFEALRDIPTDVLMDAIGHAIRTRAWFPTAAELRADCDVVHRRRPVEQAPRRFVDLDGAQRVAIKNPFGGDPVVLLITRGYSHDCEACCDTGQAARWCGDETPARMPWVPVVRCERRDEHDDHEWVEPCACAESNPTIRRRKERQMRYSHAPERVA